MMEHLCRSATLRGRFPLAREFYLLRRRDPHFRSAEGRDFLERWRTNVSFMERQSPKAGMHFMNATPPSSPLFLNFIRWLAGLIDGDGHFALQGGRCYLTIT